MHSRRFAWPLLVGCLILSCVDLEACGNGGAVKSGATSFESDLPGAGLSGRASKGGDAGTGAIEAPNQDEASRIIAEADIIQVDGERLYALSRVAGLSVIDISRPEALRILGRYRDLPAEPFEMYLRQGVVFVMFSGWGQYALGADDNYAWVTTSKLLALDVADPTQMNVLGSFDVPGSISDSRIVGDILYVVSHEDAYCWGCEGDGRLTAILSLDVSDPRAPAKVDELKFADGNTSYGARSIAVTEQRMYVAGPDYGSDMPTGSTIQVVDISDAKGTMVQGAMVAVEGQISSRWQMDEYGGVLRVISQPPQWWNGQGTTAPLPSVQTFKVTSSSVIEPLGRTDIVLPMRETLRSVRFDGPRAYAITAEQKDPLFTIDLSDPAHPREVGELQLPGFVYYMEPRGDRLLGIGFDQGNPLGAIAVSLFDVKDLANPTELSRVNFGGSWASLPADQDRIQKVFRVLDDAGLILVPFSGWRDVNVNSGCKAGGYVGGVELIDLANDMLSARGAALGQGETRRALLHAGDLLTVSDERVQRFDITNRADPKLLSKVVLASNVYRAMQLADGAVVRFAYDSYSGAPVVDLVAAEDAGDPNTSYGEIDISSLIDSSSGCPTSLSFDGVFVNGSELDLLYRSYGSGLGKGDGETQGLLVVDARDPRSARIVSNTHWTNDGQWYTYSSFYAYGYYDYRQSALRTAHTVSMLESSSEFTGGRSIQKTRLRVLDVRDPSAVTQSTLALTNDESYSGLIADGETLYLSHFATSDTNAGRGRFYLDRVDVSDPRSPRRLEAINVPGQLVAYDHASGRVLTNELVRSVVRNTTYEACYARFAYAEFGSADMGSASGSSGSARSTGTASSPSDGGMAAASSDNGQSADSGTATSSEPLPLPKGTCTGYRQRLHLLRLLDGTAELEDTIALDESKQLLQWSAGDGVVFGTIGRVVAYGEGLLAPCRGACGGVVTPAQPVELWVLGGFSRGEFELGRIQVETQSNPWSGFWGVPPLYAYGKRALLLSQSEAAIIDASDPSQPKLERTLPLIASAQYVDLRDKTALLTLGAQGVQWLSLE
jgi:hypothetical protein